MNYLLILLSCLTSFCFFAQQSIVQEQSQHYKNFQFKKDAQWDSLNAIENGIHPSSIHTAKLASTASCNLNKKVYGWHPYWNGSVHTNYDWSMLSDFCYFDYSVSPTTGNNINTSFAWATSAAVTAAKTNSVNIHFCATLFSSHSTFWGSSTAQQTFITNAINLLNSRGGNGLNIDFEGMGASDKIPFKNFMINLCNQVHAANANYKVSLALYAVDWGPAFDIIALNTVVDDFIIMGYDYYYSNSPQAGPTAPLYNFQTSNNYTLSRSITYYLKQGVPNSKLLLGLPYYGREWATAGNTIPSNTTGNFTSSRTYAYIKNNPSTYSATNKRWDNNSFTPYYSFQVSGNWRQCWTDDTYSMGRKFDMVNQRGLGGIGIWALGYDDGYQDYWQTIKSKFSDCGTVSCNDSIFDMGGPGRNYYDNEFYMYTIAPTGANQVRLTFSQMDLEAGADSLYLFDGTSTSAPLLGMYSGNINPGIINATGPAITLKFKSNGATNKGGYKAIWNCIQNSISPTTQINTPSGWVTQNFLTTYTDIDNSGGTGIDKSFYMPAFYNGIEWRANGNRGFLNDDFNTTTIHNEWTNGTGTWTINANALEQSDNANSNTNLYANIDQSLSDSYLYSFKGTISGVGPSRRAGIHIFCDDPTQSNRGNNYLIWMRPDQNSIELYKVNANILSIVKTISYSISVNTAYDYKISYNALSGELELWINSVFVTSWIDATPLTSGTAVSFRSGNSKFTIDDFKVFRSRTNTSTILVGSSNANDLRNENPTPSLSAGKINSITKDNANNISSITSQLLDVDWTKPIKPIFANDGLGNDLDTTYTNAQLDLNYTTAKDTNSGVSTYYYAIGTTAIAKDIVPWTSNGSNLSASASGLTLTSNTKYYMMVKAINGAGLVSDSTISDGVIYLSSPIGIKETNLLNELSIYPNPATDIATLSVISAVNENIHYALSDVQGKLIEQQELQINTGINNLQINICQLQLSKGIYFIKLTVNDKAVTKKLIVE